MNDSIKIGTMMNSLQRGKEMVVEMEYKIIM